MNRPVRLAEWLLLGGLAVAVVGVALRLGWAPADALLAAGGLAMLAASGGLRWRAARAESADAGCRRLLEIACDAVVVVRPARRLAHLRPRTAALLRYPPHEPL